MSRLLIDLETRSVVDLKTAGHRRYARDPSTRITTACWKWAHESVIYSACNIPGLEHLGSRRMADFQQALGDAEIIVAHNIGFDANVIFHTLGPAGLSLEKLDCTMARAQRVSLPGGLDELCKALAVPGKSPEGHKLVMATCQPRKNGAFNEEEDVFRALMQYNVQDVVALESVDRALPPLSPEEMRIWRRTWMKNAFGLPLDLELCRRVAAKREQIELELAEELRQITGGSVTQITQRARAQTWLNNNGVGIPNLQRATIESWLDIEELPFEAWRLLTILFESGGSAPTKAQALLNRHVSGYFQDATRYFGARSGRGTSEGVNTFNISRPSGLYEPEEVIERLKAQPDGVFSNTELSDVLRGIIVAPEGRLLIDADLSNIELRLSLWYAGDQEKLELLDSGADLYAAAAAHALGIPKLTKKTHPRERQSFKKMTLMGGYAAGVNKTFQSFKTDKDLPYEYRRDLTLAQVTAIHSGYRDANVPLQMAWKGLDQAARNALYHRGARVPACSGKLTFLWRTDVDVLELILPSGRVLPHYRPRIHTEGERAGELTFWRARYGRMMEQKTFGGGWLELACQSAARDLICGVEAAIEDELPDVQLVLDVYDSVIGFAPQAVAEKRLEQILDIMRRVPAWAAGLPLNGEGYVAERMKK